MVSEGSCSLGKVPHNKKAEASVKDPESDYTSVRSKDEQHFYNLCKKEGMPLSKYGTHSI